jgi:hypothetical protein
MFFFDCPSGRKICGLCVRSNTQQQTLASPAIRQINPHPDRRHRLDQGSRAAIPWAVQKGNWLFHLDSLHGLPGAHHFRANCLS